MRRLLPLALLSALLLAPPLAPAAAPPHARTILLGDCLVLPSVGRYGRIPLHLDALESEIVTGRWRAPRVGDRLALPGGPLQTWAQATARNGAVAHPALLGGYLYWPVRVSAPRIMLLEASGPALAYVNGEPRVGDIYGHGYVRLPVRLRAGVNDLLFHCGRGGVQARLTTPATPAVLDTRDLTLPDLVHGEKGPVWAAAVVLNASDRPLRASLDAASPGAPPLTTPFLSRRERKRRRRKDQPAAVPPLRTDLPTIPPLSIRKVAFQVAAPVGMIADSVPLELRLEVKEGKHYRTLDSARITLRRRSPNQSHKRTFRSGIDGSIQYYAVQPARPAPGDRRPPALVLTLHGAAVEASRQADAYACKSWAHIVAPTNRRPFGFDWQDWGRLDALEVLAHAQRRLGTNPRRTYLTGHSMGGHGTWHLGVTFPDRWAAIAPSAGWISFYTYGGTPPPSRPTPVEAMLYRSIAPGDTLSLVRNCAGHGVYILHGDNDTNVRVDQARHMRRVLGEFHPDFAYHEQRGAGHWWGDACVDWPPLFAFLAERILPRRQDVRAIDFTTASPGVSAWCHWACIAAQLRPLQPSTIHLRCDPGRRRFHGSTANVARLALDLAPVAPGKPIEVELDGQKLGALPWPGKEARLWLQRVGGKWAATARPASGLKGPHRYGPFKEVFRNEVVFVYGTHGSAAENAWAFARARLDAEMFWYRGNASVDVVADRDFDPARQRDRNVVLYGHSQSNGAWKGLLGASPVQVRRGRLEVGGWSEKGDRACLFVRPRPGSDRALVGVVSGTTLPGMRLTDRLGYFVSGIGYPDCLVLSPEVLTQGHAGVCLAGFFGLDWGAPTGEFAWRKDD
jgi:poly(3-hydroxybutyrate) depolymerase